MPAPFGILGITFMNIESILRKYVKYLWYNLFGRFQLNVSTSKRKSHSDLSFHKLLTVKIDCPELTSQFDFLMLKVSNTSSSLFYWKTPRTNVLKIFPIYMVCLPCRNDRTNKTNILIYLLCYVESFC